MGRMAVNLLVRQLQNQRIEALHVQLATKLVVRESSGALLVRDQQDAVKLPRGRRRKLA